MSQYERTLAVDATPDEIFAYVSDLNNLPEYLPTVHHAEPQQNERIRIQGKAAGHKYDSDGYFRVDTTARRMAWGSDGDNNYSGWLTVNKADQASTVTVHLSFEPKPEEEEEFAKPTGDRDTTINQGIDASLQSIKNIIEGKGGKVPTPAG